ncbi:ribonuclease R [Anaerolentibacter hominis]|uniref:ribonuclease R n=1 Tax=Anaerolentibacter hominis TaxID=3079009 RepID=UPI0031B8A320
MEIEKLEERKQKVFEYISSNEYKPLKLNEMAGFLQVPRGDKPFFRQILDTLQKEGKIVIDGKGRYRLPADDIKVGTFSGTERGFGFAVIEGEDDDVFIPESKTKGALHGDRIQIQIVQASTGTKRREGVVLKILERANEIVVGTFQKSRNFGFVITDNKKFNKDIFISKGQTKGAVSGHKVLVKLTSYGDEKKNPEGVVLEILGHINDPKSDVISIVKAYGLPEQFPEEVLHQIQAIPEEVQESEKEGRLDLRNLPTVTIDGEDAKDLDDAISISKEGTLYHLGVHIADVSHYVRENSPLDKEALKRGTSAYLVDSVIPMLPHKLSNGICSLNAGTDRLALSCLMDIDGNGTIVSHQITETLIQVDRRMTYTNVQKILDGDAEVCKEYEGFVPMFQLMQELAGILREQRRKRGSIDFDFPESKILTDENGAPVEIKAYERNTATRIIEDFMLAANETVAEDYFWQELPFVYRTHEAPDEEKMRSFGIFINNFGFSIHLGKNEIHPKELQKLIAKLDGNPNEALISRLMLRSMKRAQYTTQNLGHFGLSTKYYCHFTSPIRRYPDLQIHRIIKENLHGKLNGKRIAHYNAVLGGVAASSSALERRADEAEMEVEKLKKVEYMSRHLNESFEGVISGVTGWGIFVELANTVEGLIRLETMKDDYYIYDAEQYQLTGEHSKKVYKLGQKVKIRAVSADKLLRTIDFEMEN